MKAVMTGSSGFVGRHLLHRLKHLGYSVTEIGRDELKLPLNELETLFEGANIVINLAGAPIISRWSEKYKKVLTSSRIDTTTTIVRAIEGLEIKPQLFISTSAVGIYSNDGIHTEDSVDYADDFLSDLCRDWEFNAKILQTSGVKTAIFRYGVVLGRDGGAFQKMLLPFKLGLGGVIGDGKQGFSFIHIDDLIGAYEFVISNIIRKCDGDCSTVYNLSTPEPTTNRGFTKALGKALHRPTILPLPKFVLQLIYGEGSRVLTDGQQMIPERLLKEGYQFKYKNVEEVVEALVNE